MSDVTFNMQQTLWKFIVSKLNLGRLLWLLLVINNDWWPSSVSVITLLMNHLFYLRGRLVGCEHYFTG